MTTTPRHRDLVRPDDGLSPRPSSLATQEIRFALAFTGGVSLAVWMGGVARELNLLVQASGRRRNSGDSRARPPDPDPVRDRYRKLLDLIDADVAIDVLAGTSAGGINCALLGLVNARSLDLGPLRDIWLEAGDFGKLMRHPSEVAPPSLLRGDGQMLSALRKGIGQLLQQRPLSRENPETDVYVTTTFLSPEHSHFTDDYGTEIADSDHHGRFHFTTADLLSAGIGGPLALAARSSASFPGAFEPSFIPYGPATADRDHPDMSAYSNATGPHWAADGGLLVNRPLAPLMQRMFERSADREVRRALLYVAPTTACPDETDPDEQASPLGLVGALRKDLGAALNQSIAADLAAIRSHNEQVRSIADTGRRMAVLGRRLPRNEWLSDESAWPGPGPFPPRDAAAVLDAAVALGRPAFEGAKATMLRLLRLARSVARTKDQRYALAIVGRYASRPAGTGATLRRSWQELRGVFEASRAWLRRLDGSPALEDYLAYFDRKDDVVAGFLDLYMVSRSVLPVHTDVAQPVELIQVSADTRTLLAPDRDTADRKLTGLQMHHFGAFYKPSWRANDWMWGRLDGCGWLVHILLDPRRIRAVLENDGVPVGARASTLVARLQDDLGVTVDDLDDLCFLDDQERTVPRSLPKLAMQVAAAFQEDIARLELPVVADQARERPSAATARWLARTSGVAEQLNGCPIGQERIVDEARERTPLFIRTATQAAAVATAAATGVDPTPTSLKPTFATARTITRTAYAVADQARGTRRRMVQFGLAMLVLATLALFTSIPLLGLPAVVLFGAGAVVLGFGVGPRLIDGLRILLAFLVLLLAFAPWVAWLWPRVNAMLTGSIRLINQNHWTWPVVLLLVLLPPASAIGNFLRRRRAQSADG